MIEKRKSRRIPVTLHLNISSLYRENQLSEGIQGLDSPIEVVDISAGGVAFISECVLPLGYFFDASLTSENSSENVFTIVKIIRSHAVDQSHYFYGCQFTTQLEDVAEFIRRTCA